MQVIRNTSGMFKKGAKTRIYFYERPDHYLESQQANRFKVAEFRSIGDADLFLSVWHPSNGYAVEVVR